MWGWNKPFGIGKAAVLSICGLSATHIIINKWMQPQEMKVTTAKTIMIIMTTTIVCTNPWKWLSCKNFRQKSTSWAYTNLCQMTASRQMAWWQKTEKKERKKKKALCFYRCAAAWPSINVSSRKRNSRSCDKTF